MKNQKILFKQTGDDGNIWIASAVYGSKNNMTTNGYVFNIRNIKLIEPIQRINVLSTVAVGESECKSSKQARQMRYSPYDQTVISLPSS